MNRKKSNQPGYNSDVEMIEQTTIVTLAQKLGVTAHVSSLLRKACGLSRYSDRSVGEWLLKCAVTRGASHYERDFSNDLPDDSDELSDEEVSVALCLGQLPYNSAYIRAASQLLSSPKTDAPQLVRLAVMERVEPVMLHIANAALRCDSEAQPWAYLRQNLKLRAPLSTDALPHWSRFVSQTGVTPFGGGPDIKWLKRREQLK